MKNADDQALARAAIADAARALLRGELSMIAAARLIDGHAHTIDPDMNDEELLGFQGIDSQSDHLAIGPALENWHPSLRDAKRREVEDFERFYHDESLRDAAILVERYRSAT